MRKIRNIEDALTLFEFDMIVYGESEDYKKANKAYNQGRKIVKYLLENNSIERLKEFYNSDNLWVRLNAATYLAPIDNENSYAIVEGIVNSGVKGVSVDAEFCIKEWHNLSNRKVYDKILSE